MRQAPDLEQRGQRAGGGPAAQRLARRPRAARARHDGRPLARRLLRCAAAPRARGPPPGGGLLLAHPRQRLARAPGEADARRAAIRGPRLPRQRAGQDLGRGRAPRRRRGAPGAGEEQPAGAAARLRQRQRQDALQRIAPAARAAGLREAGQRREGLAPAAAVAQEVQAAQREEQVAGRQRRVRGGRRARAAAQAGPQTPRDARRRRMRGVRAQRGQPRQVRAQHLAPAVKLRRRRNRGRSLARPHQARRTCVGGQQRALVGHSRMLRAQLRLHAREARRAFADDGRAEGGA